MPALEKNHIYRSTIEGYSSEGLGVARIDGQVVFVHDAVRGEDCDILVMKVLKNVAFGKPVLRHSTSPHRQEPDCPYYGRCGGCDFRHLDYAEELWAKRQRVQDALTRLGGSDVTVEEILGAAQPLRHVRQTEPCQEGMAQAAVCGGTCLLPEPGAGQVLHRIYPGGVRMASHSSGGIPLH